MYLKPWFAVFVGASYQYFSLHDVDAAQTGHGFAGDVGVGFRVRNTRLDLSVEEQGDRSSGAFGPWRRSLTLSAFTVIKRRVALTATGTLVQGGEEGSFEVEVFPTKSAGVFVSGFAGQFEPYVTPTLATRYAGSAGFAGWLDANTALVGEYELTYEMDPATPPSTSGYNELCRTPWCSRRTSGFGESGMTAADLATSTRVTRWSPTSRSATPVRRSATSVRRARTCPRSSTRRWRRRWSRASS